MGSRGPVPKLSAERRRRNAMPGEMTVEVDGAVKVPRIAPTYLRYLHPVARDWYKSLAASGQTVRYEPSDWQLAIATALLMSNVLRSEPNGSAMNALLGYMKELNVTDPARRRAGIEIQRVVEGRESEPPPAKVSAMDDYRRQAAQ